MSVPSGMASYQRPHPDIRRPRNGRHISLSNMTCHYNAHDAYLILGAHGNCQCDEFENILDTAALFCHHIDNAKTMVVKEVPEVTNSILLHTGYSRQYDTRKVPLARQKTGNILLLHLRSLCSSLRDVHGFVFLSFQDIAHVLNFDTLL